MSSAIQSKNKRKRAITNAQNKLADDKKVEENLLLPEAGSNKNVESTEQLLQQLCAPIGEGIIHPVAESEDSDDFVSILPSATFSSRNAAINQTVRPPGDRTRRTRIAVDSAAHRDSMSTWNFEMVFASDFCSPNF